MLLIGLCAVALCGCATALARDYLTLLGGQLLGSISIATLEGVALAVAGARFVGRARQRAMSAITGAIGASSVVGLPPRENEVFLLVRRQTNFGEFPFYALG